MVVGDAASARRLAACETAGWQPALHPKATAPRAVRDRQSAAIKWTSDEVGKKPAERLRCCTTGKGNDGALPSRSIKCAIKQISRGGVGRKKVTWLRPPGFAKLSTFGSGGS